MILLSVSDLVVLLTIIYIYDSQIVYHNPCFNLSILHNNSFDNQGSKINKNDIFLHFDVLSFTKIFFLHVYIYGIHHWRIVSSSYRKLAWVVFKPTTTEFCSDTVTDWAIRPWVQLALRTNFVQLLQFHCLFQCQVSFRLLASSVLHLWIFTMKYKCCFW